jgi:hypothetical protein
MSPAEVIARAPAATVRDAVVACQLLRRRAAHLRRGNLHDDEAAALDRIADWLWDQATCPDC